MFQPPDPGPNNAQDVQRHMEETARNQRTQKKLIFDKVNKRIIAVDVNDPRADQSLQFTPKEATRF